MRFRETLALLSLVLLLCSCGRAEIKLPPPPEEPAVLVDSPTCVSCGSLLEPPQLQHLIEQSQLGDAQAAFLVSMHYSSADQPELRDRWLARAGGLGHPVAQYNKWFLLRKSAQCADRTEALGWLVKAAAQGQPDAVRELRPFQRLAKKCRAKPGGAGKVPPNNSFNPMPLRGTG